MNKTSKSSELSHNDMPAEVFPSLPRVWPKKHHSNGNDVPDSDSENTGRNSHNILDNDSENKDSLCIAEKHGSIEVSVSSDSISDEDPLALETDASHISGTCVQEIALPAHLDQVTAFKNDEDEVKVAETNDPSLEDGESYFCDAQKECEAWSREEEATTEADSRLCHSKGRTDPPAYTPPKVMYCQQFPPNIETPTFGWKAPLHRDQT